MRFRFPTPSWCVVSTAGLLPLAVTVSRWSRRRVLFEMLSAGDDGVWPQIPGQHRRLLPAERVRRSPTTGMARCRRRRSDLYRGGR